MMRVPSTHVTPVGGSMHGRRDEGVDFIFSPEVTPTIPEDVVGRWGRPGV